MATKGKPVKASAVYKKCPHCAGDGMYLETALTPPRRFECPWCHGRGHSLKQENSQ